MQKSKNLLSRFLHDDNGATMIEYGLLVALISFGCIALFTATGGSISSLLGTEEGGVANSLQSVVAQ